MRITPRIMEVDLAEYDARDEGDPMIGMPSGECDTR